MERKVQKIRNGFQVVIPKQFADMIGITSATVMEMRYENNELVMTPKHAGD
jgi:antitoxin component of MazEF toxin-antitoxin module